MSLGLQVLAALCVGLAAWLWSGALAVTGTQATFRVGLLPPWWFLGLSLILSCGLTFWRGPRPSRLLPLLLSAFLILPWIPGAVPASFLLWHRPLSTLVWAAVIVGLGARIPVPTRWKQAATSTRHAPRLAFAGALMVYVLAVHQLSVWLPGGDEPHYLVIADSLRRDGDLRIENNHRDRNYLAYFPGELRPDYLQRGRDGQIYSVHAPGLPALIVPAFAAGGYRGAALFLAVISALASTLVWKLGWEVTRNRGAAWFGWAATTLSTPFVFHAVSVYPDAAGAVLVLIGTLALVRSASLNIAQLVCCGAALSFLPWLHTRYAVLAAGFGIALGLRLWQAPRWKARLTAFSVVPAVSAAAWFTFFYAIYGTFNPAAPYGAQTQTAASHIIPGLLGLFFDQQFGLLPNAPVFIVPLGGIVAMIVRRLPADPTQPAQDAADAAPVNQRRLGIEILLIVSCYILAASSFRMWWGGWSAPARFLVPVLLMLSAPAAFAWASARTRTTRASAIFALTLTIWLTGTLLAVYRGRLAYNDRDGFALWMDWASPLADLSYGFPSLHRVPWPEALEHVTLWVAVLAGAWFVLRIIERGLTRHASLFARTVVPLTYGVGVMFTLTSMWHLQGVSGLRPNLSQTNLMQHYVPRLRPVGIVYGEVHARAENVPAENAAAEDGLPHFVEASSILPRLRLETSVRRAPRERPLLFVTNVPAGRYGLIVHGRQPMRGRLTVTIGRTTNPTRTFEIADPAPSAGQHDIAFELSLPIDVHSVTVTGDADARATVAEAFLRPSVVYRPPALLAHDAFALRAYRYGAYVAYAVSDDVYQEPAGMWLRAQRSTMLVVQADQGTGVPRLYVRNGPLRNTVDVETGAGSRQLEMTPGQEFEMPLALGGPQRAAAVRLHAAEGFRPVELDPASRDVRFLGVWLEIR